MARYPTTSGDAGYLDPRNPFFQKLRDSITELKSAERDWYQHRLEFFQELNAEYGGLSKTADEVERDYDNDIGNQPWEYLSTFNRVNDGRRSGSGVRLVQDRYSVDLGLPINPIVLVANGTDEEGDPCGGSSHVLPEDRSSNDDSCDPDPLPNVLDYVPGAGAPGIDCLYTNLAAFQTNTTIFGVYVVEGEEDDDGDPTFDLVEVFTGFGEVPFAWKQVSGYTKRQLSSMKAAGESYNERVKPKIDAYNSAKTDFDNVSGGRLNFDYIGGTIDFPWQNFTGSNVSYNRPQKGGGGFSKIVNEARGVGK